MMARRTNVIETLSLAFCMLNCAYVSLATETSVQSRLDALESGLSVQKKEIDVLQLENEQQEWTIRSLRSELTLQEAKVAAMAKQHEQQIQPLQKVYGSGILSLLGKDRTRGEPRQKRLDLGNDVAFFAKVGGHDPLHLATGDAIAFNNVVTQADTEGQSYNANSGTFTAPYDGLYVFSTTIKSEKHEGTTFGLFMNQEQKAELWVPGGDPEHSGTSSETVILDMQTGDKITVKVVAPHPVGPVGPDPHGPPPPHPDDAVVSVGFTTFTGFLLSQSSQLTIVG